MNKFVLIFLFSLILGGVLGIADDVWSVSVMEGDSVTLYIDSIEIQRNDLILLRFGQILLAKINGQNNEIQFYDGSADGRFRDRLKLDQTGSLTITNTRPTDSGLYKFISTRSETPLNTFNLIVYAALPIPLITSDSSQCSSAAAASKCALVCSVSNVSHVTLSWFKGNSLLSSITVSDLSVSLSLPLEVEYQDKNTYSCVVNSPIRNQTQYLNISELCQTCPGVSGDDAVKSVSVMEGDSLTLHTDDTEQRGDEIEWRFGNIRIARVIGNIPRYDDESFRDRLKMDQTGSLTITNIRTTDCGLYKLSTISENQESIKRFSITVDARPPAPAVTPQNPLSSEVDAGI